MNIIKISNTQYEVKITIQNGRQGQQGVQGIQGIQGPQGSKGDKGDRGLDGKDGAATLDFYCYAIGDNIVELLEDSYENIDFRGVYFFVDAAINFNAQIKNIKNLNIVLNTKERLFNVVNSTINFENCQIIINNPQNGILISAINSIINFKNTDVYCGALQCTDWICFDMFNSNINAKYSEININEISTGNQDEKNLKMVVLDNDSLATTTAFYGLNCRLTMIYSSTNTVGGDIFYIKPTAVYQVEINLTFCVFIHNNISGSYSNDFNIRLDDNIHLRGCLIGYLYVRNESLLNTWQPNMSYRRVTKLQYNGECYMTLYDYTSAATIAEDIANGNVRVEGFKLAVNKGNSIDGTNRQTFL